MVAVVIPDLGSVNALEVMLLLESLVKDHPKNSSHAMIKRLFLPELLV